MKKIGLLIVLVLSANAAEKKVLINIEGMTCPLCTAAVKKSLKKTDGVLKAKVFLNTHQAVVKIDDTKVKYEDLLKAIKNAGYKGKILEVKDEN